MKPAWSWYAPVYSGFSKSFSLFLQRSCVSFVLCGCFLSVAVAGTVSILPTEEQASADTANTLRTQVLTLARAGTPQSYEALRKLALQYPENDTVQLWLARVAVQQGDSATALPIYERLIPRYPQDAPLLLEKARVHILLGEIDQARTLIEQARELAGVSQTEAEALLQRLQEEKRLEQLLQEAEQAQKEGKAEQAHQRYMLLWREAPDNPRVLLGVARTASVTGRHPYALTAYETLLSRYPKDSGLRLEYTRVLVALGDKEAAKQQLGRIRADNPSLSEEQMSRFLASMIKERSEFIVEGRLSSGYIYDTNVNAAPLHKDVTVGGWPILLDEGSTAQRSWGLFASTALDLAWRNTPESRWWLVGDVLGYQKWYMDVDGKDTTYGRAGTGVRYTGDKLFLDIRAKAETVLEDNRSTVNIAGAEGSFSWMPVPRFSLLTRGGFERRDYENTFQSGQYYWLGEYARFLFTEKGHSFTVGGRWLGANASDKRSSSSGEEFSAQIGFNLPWSVELYFSGSYRHDRYEAPATFLEIDDRDDEQLRGGAFLTWYMTPTLSLDIAYQYTKNNSNSPLYTYDQHFVSSGLTWKF